MLNFGASKPRVKGGPGPQGPPGSTPDNNISIVKESISWSAVYNLRKKTLVAQPDYQIANPGSPVTFQLAQRLHCSMY